MPDESKDISGIAGNPQKDSGTANKKVLSPTMNKGPFIPRVPKFEGKCVIHNFLIYKYFKNMIFFMKYFKMSALKN